MLILSSTATPLAALSLCPPPSSLKVTTTLPLDSVNASFTRVDLLPLSPRTTTTTRGKWTVVNKAGESQSATVASPTSANVVDDKVLDSAAEVVRNFYGGINAHDVDSVEDLISENCVYEDLVFPRPFVGRKVIYVLGTNLLV